MLFGHRRYPGAPPGSHDLFLPSHLSDPHFLLRSLKLQTEKEKILTSVSTLEKPLRYQIEEEEMPNGKALGFGSESRSSSASD